VKKLGKKELLAIVLGVLLAVAIGVKAYGDHQVNQELVSVTVVDAQGQSHTLSLEQGEWFFAKTETPFQYVEYLFDGQVLTGWTTENLWSQRERDNVHRLTPVIEASGHQSIEQISDQLGLEVYGSSCTEVSFDYPEQYEEYEGNAYTHCQLYYPDPTIEALRVLPLQTESELYWTVADEVRRLDGARTLLLGDSSWSGEWRIAPTYFYDYEGHWYVAFVRFGACTVSISDGQGFYAEVPSDWLVEYQGRFGESLIHVYMIPSWNHDQEWVVASESPLTCQPSVQHEVITDYDPLPPWGA
jgi:hypothetical protein